MANYHKVSLMLELMYMVSDIVVVGERHYLL